MSVFRLRSAVARHILVMIARVVASVVAVVVTAQVGAVTASRVHLELPVFTLLGDGVHLGEEYCGDKHPSCSTEYKCIFELGSLTQ